MFDRDLLVGNKEVPINVEDESAHDDEEHRTNVEPEQPIPQDWNTYQNGPTGEDIFPGNRLERTKKIPGKDYMILVIDMLDKKYVRDLLEDGKPKLHYKDEKGKRCPLGKSAIKYYLKQKYIRSIPPEKDPSLDNSSTQQVKILMVSDDHGRDHLQNVVEVFDATLFDELYFHDKHMTSKPVKQANVEEGENTYGKYYQEDNVAHVQIVVDGKHEDLDGITPEQLGTIQSFEAFRGNDEPSFISKMIDLGQLAITPTLSELEGYLGKGTYADRTDHIHYSYQVKRVMEDYKYGMKTLVHLAKRYVLGIPTVQQVFEVPTTTSAVDSVETVEIEVPKGTKAALSEKHYPQWHEVTWKELNGLYDMDCIEYDKLDDP